MQKRTLLHTVSSITTLIRGFSEIYLNKIASYHTGTLITVHIQKPSNDADQAS